MAIRSYVNFDISLMFPFFSCLEQVFEDERNGKRKADSRSIASDHRKKVKDWGD